MHHLSAASYFVMATVFTLSAVHGTKLSQKEYRTFTNGGLQEGQKELHGRGEGNPYMLVVVLESCTVFIVERY